VNSALQTAWSRLLFGSLSRAGLRDVVISPGSRSTPFTWAALNTSGLTCHAVPDERSAAFFALGQARINGRPSALLCTSGSAAAHYFPAIVEASQAYVPLLVLSADRPFELMDCGAAQAMDQVKLYGDFARRYFELGHPDASDAALDALVRIVSQALSSTLGPLPGPVHVNLRARKPLEPVVAASAEERALERAVNERLERGAATIHARPHPATPGELEALCAACDAAERGLIVCGPLPASGAAPNAALLELARASGFGLLAETTSQVRHLGEPPSGVTLLGSAEAVFESSGPTEPLPQVVLQIGRPPTASSYERWLARTRVPRAVVTEHGWLDPSNRADWLVECDAALFARTLVERLAPPSAARASARRAYRAELERRDTRYWQAVDAIVAAQESEGLSEARSVQLALAALPDGALLGLGNSLPLRDVDSFVRPFTRHLRVWSQRGVNGIDGLVAGAAGAARAALAPSLLLLGDVSLLHDVGSLFLAREVRTPFVILMIDNAGGRIFDELPIQEALAARPELARFWRTPPDLDFAHAAALFGIDYALAEDEPSLEAALRKALALPRCTLLHARVVPESAQKARAQVRARFLAAAPS